MKKAYLTFGPVFVIVIFLTLLLGVSCSFSSAYAEDSITYSNVVDDLSESEYFDVSDYPVDNSNYGLYVLTIAESNDGELFIYVYQPCFVKNFRATSVSMSVSTGNNISPMFYGLSFINKSGTLYKYKVADCTVSSNSVRYYEIYSIFRRYDSAIDDAPSDSSQTINEVSFQVAKKWAISSSGGNYSMDAVDVEVITITDKFVGFVRYPDGFVWLGVSGACDSHFVAFSTDKPIDRLFQADVYYTSQSYHRDWAQTSGAIETYGSILENTVTLNYTDKSSYQGGGLFAYKYVWNRIESVSDFISNTENSSIYSGAILNVSTGTTINDEVKRSLQSKQWVLRFTETSYHHESAGSGLSAIAQTSSTLVGNVSILRLCFETDGVVYNLGVVDNKQTGSTQPVNHGSHQTISPGYLFTEGFSGMDMDWLKIVLFVVGGILLVVLVVVLIRFLIRFVDDRNRNHHKKNTQRRSSWQRKK